MDEPGSRLAVAAPVSADLLLNCEVPAMDPSDTSWDGTDDGQRSKDPLLAQS